jgi:hypothetical protein
VARVPLRRPSLHARPVGIDALQVLDAVGAADFADDGADGVVPEAQHRPGPASRYRAWRYASPPPKGVRSEAHRGPMHAPRGRTNALGETVTRPSRRLDRRDRCLLYCRNTCPGKCLRGMHFEAVACAVPRLGRVG